MNQLDDRPTKLNQENNALKLRIRALEQRCAEAEDALNAIRSGLVDALVIYGDEGEKVYTIQGAEQAYRVLVESINEGAVTLIGDGTILYCNCHFAEMLNTPQEAIIGSSIHKYISPEYKTIFSALLLQGLQGSCRNEVNLLSKDGLRIPVMASLKSFDAGSGPGVCLVTADLTEQKRSEELTRQEALSADRFSEFSKLLVEVSLNDQAIMEFAARSAVQLVGDACIIRLLSADHQWLEPAGHYYPNADIDQAFQEVLAKVTLHADEGIVGRVVQSGEPVILPSRKLILADSGIKPEFAVLLKRLKASCLLVVPIRTRHQVIGALMLMRLSNGKAYTPQDLANSQRIADQMALALTNAQLSSDLQDALQKEQTMQLQLIQAEKLSALSRMMASVVHEINNPMQAIKNWVFLARSATPDNTPQAEYLNMVSLETERISKLVSNLRVFYRPPKAEPMQPLDLYITLQEVRLMLDTHLRHQNIVWQVVNPPDSLWVRGMADQLKQVFLNICLNAIEAMQPEGGVITVSSFVSQSRNEIVAAVKNTGPGIRPENMPKIFEPFFTTKENGTGLGLAICYEIIQSHSGTISVESTPDKGTTFTIRLPRADA